MWRAWFPWPNQCRAASVLHFNLSQNWWSNCWFLGWTHGECGGTRDIDERRLHSTNCLLEGTRRNRNSGNLEGTPWSGSTATLGLFDQVIGDIWWSREMSDEDHEDSNLFFKTSHWHREKQHNPTCKYREIASGNTYCTMCHDWKLKSRFGAYLEPQPPVLSWLVWKDPIICTIVLCVCVSQCQHTSCHVIPFLHIPWSFEISIKSPKIHDTSAMSALRNASCRFRSGRVVKPAFVSFEEMILEDDILSCFPNLWNVSKFQFW